MVDVTIPVEPEAAAALTDARRREAVGRLVSRLLRPKSGPRLIENGTSEVNADGAATGLTDADIAAELTVDNPACGDPGYAVADRMREITGAVVVARASAAAFGRRLVTNNLRALLVEAMIAEVLPAGWKWVSADWAGWDFESADSIKLEVKQSAAKQTWAKELSPPSKCSFDIAAGTGYWEGGDKWIEGRRRYADIYLFAHHPIADASADHRDPLQWRFYVILETALPAATKTIALASLQQISPAVCFHDLPERVEKVRSEIALKSSQTQAGPEAAVALADA